MENQPNEQESAELLQANELPSPTNFQRPGRRRVVALVSALAAVGLVALGALCWQRQPLTSGSANSFLNVVSLAAEQNESEQTTVLLIDQPTEQPTAFYSEIKSLDSFFTAYQERMKECYPPGWNASNATPTAVKESSTQTTNNGVSIFCWAFILPASKVKTEKDLLEIAAQRKIGPFGCDDHVLYGIEPDVVGGSCVRVIPGLNPWVPKVPKYVGGGRVQYNRANTPVFRSIWETVVKDGLWKNHDWTIKLDPDTTFLADRMRNALSLPRYRQGANSPKGAFLTNCGGQVYGGAEVISRKGMAEFSTYVSHCYGSPREDEWWAECLRRLGIWGQDASGAFCLRGCNCDYMGCWGPQAAWHAAESTWQAKVCAGRLQR